MRLRSGDKHHLRKSADRKAQISLVSGTHTFLICAFRSACGRTTTTVQAPAKSLLSVRKCQAVFRCFHGKGESPRSRKSATFFVSSCLDTLPNFSRVGSGPASTAHMVQQVTCTHRVVGESRPAYIALCPNVMHKSEGQAMLLTLCKTFILKKVHTIVSLALSNCASLQTRVQY